MRLVKRTGQGCKEANQATYTDGKGNNRGISARGMRKQRYGTNVPNTAQYCSNSCVTKRRIGAYAGRQTHELDLETVKGTPPTQANNSTQQQPAGFLLWFLLVSTGLPSHLFVTPTQQPAEHAYTSRNRPPTVQLPPRTTHPPEIHVYPSCYRVVHRLVSLVSISILEFLYGTVILYRSLIAIAMVRYIARV